MKDAKSIKVIVLQIKDLMITFWIKHKTQLPNPSSHFVIFRYFNEYMVLEAKIVIVLLVHLLSPKKEITLPQNLQRQVCRMQRCKGSHCLCQKNGDMLTCT